MLKELLKPEINELISGRDWNNLKDVLVTWPAPEIADLLLDIEKPNRVVLFRVLPRELAADIFSFLEHDQRDSLLFDLTDQETRELLEDLSPDDRTDLLEELPAKVTRHMLNLLSPEDLIEARQLLGYPEDSIGRQMTPDFIAIRPEWTIANALDHIRKFGKDSETIYRIYVTDKNGKLLDDILLRQFIIADTSQNVSTLMDHNVVSISAFEDQEEAVKKMERYDLFAVPVVDSAGMLVGIVTFDDVLDISEEETTEDIHKLGAVNPVEQNYLTASVPKLWLKRVPWLLTLLFANTLTAHSMKSFNSIIDAIPVLANFIPLLIGTAGNSGVQSSTLIIRSLSLDEITIKNWWEILRKEMNVGALLSVALGSITFLIAWYIAEEQPVKLALVVSISLMVMIMWANILGSFLPLILSKFKLDPAVISSPLIATLIDVTGIFIYFKVAVLVLDELLARVL